MTAKMIEDCRFDATNQKHGGGNRSRNQHGSRYPDFRGEKGIYGNGRGPGDAHH